jgi:hypothetical protein
LDSARVGVLDLIAPGLVIAGTISVPDALASYVIEAGRASDYDHLLLAAGGAHKKRGV